MHCNAKKCLLYFVETRKIIVHFDKSCNTTKTECLTEIDKRDLTVLAE